MGRSHILALAMLLTACGGATTVKPQVLTPPPSAPRSEFFVEKAEVRSREVGSEAWRRNAEYSRVLTDALRSALRDRGKTLSAPPADRVRARVYLAFGAAPVKSKDSRKAKAHVEVRLQLLDAATRKVLYTTHTLAPLSESVLAKFGFGTESDQVIREVLEKTALDFASRL